MAKDAKCPTCGSFLNRVGVCLTCHPTGRARPPAKHPSHGNAKDSDNRRRRGK